MLRQSLAAWLTIALTEFPFHLLIVDTHVVAYPPVQMLETRDRLRDATDPFENIANDPVNVKSR